MILPTGGWAMTVSEFWAGRIASGEQARGIIFNASASLFALGVIGVIAGLVLGKPIGILTATFLTSKLTGRSLQKGLTWPDLTGVALLGGIGFTVSLLIGELAFGLGSARDDHVRLGILVGSVLSAMLATVVLRLRNRHYRRVEAEETRDDDADGVPDVYARPDPAIGS